MQELMLNVLEKYHDNNPQYIKEKATEEFEALSKKDRIEVIRKSLTMLKKLLERR